MKRSLGEQIRYDVIQNLFAAQRRTIKSGTVQEIIVLSNYIFELSEKCEKVMTETSDTEEVAKSSAMKKKEIKEEVNKYANMVDPAFFHCSYAFANWKRTYEKTLHSVSN